MKSLNFILALLNNMFKKINRFINVAFILPIRWKYQKMQTIDNISYPTSKELHERMEKAKLQMPALLRARNPRGYYLQGEVALIEEILYGRNTTSGKTH